MNSKVRRQELITEFEDIFCIKLRAGSLFDFEPMKIKFEGPTHLVNVRQRAYSLKQLSILKKKVEALFDVGYIVRKNALK